MNNPYKPVPLKSLTKAQCIQILEHISPFAGERVNAALADYYERATEEAYQRWRQHSDRPTPKAFKAFNAHIRHGEALWTAYKQAVKNEQRFIATYYTRIEGDKT